MHFHIYEGDVHFHIYEGEWASTWSTVSHSSDKSEVGGLILFKMSRMILVNYRRHWCLAHSQEGHIRNVSFTMCLYSYLSLSCTSISLWHTSASLWQYSENPTFPMPTFSGLLLRHSIAVPSVSTVGWFFFRTQGCFFLIGLWVCLTASWERLWQKVLGEQYLASILSFQFWEIAWLLLPGWES